MAKKRVHELAKEFGIENKDVIEILQQAGMSVKSHSNSVDEDEARAAIVKVKGPSEAAAPKRKRPGMRIVKKRAKTEEPAAEEAPAAEAAPEEAPAVEEEAPAEEAAPAPEPEVEVAAEASEEPAAEAAPEEAAAEEAPADDKGPKKKVGAQVVRMIDREKLMERIPSRRLGGGGPRHQDSGPKFGQVTELRVVQDPFGRGREMVDVGRDKKGGKGKAKRSRAPTKREVFQMRERVMHPSRLRKKKAVKRTSSRKTEVTQPKASKRVIRMKEEITISELAKELQIKVREIFYKIVDLGIDVHDPDDAVNFETAQLVANDYEYTVESIAFDEEELLKDAEEKDEDLKSRPPVVTVMGHVDHGKTSVLDAIRKSRVADKEAGGITQHIGAYQVTLPKKGTITFLDTPGHAAFTEMRARGAQATDIVILVVAADDGVMPQTEEAARHAQAAGVPIIVALNKIDKPEANPDKVIQELTKLELVPEDWGGDTLYVKTSATTGEGIQELLETILLQSEVLDFRANPKKSAEGVVVEAKLDKGRGAVATLLVQSGTLKRGDHFVVGHHSGKIRAMTDDQGKQVKQAGPSCPVEIIGLEGVPNAGDPFNAVKDANAAKKLAEHRQEAAKKTDQKSGPKMSLDDLMAKMRGEEALELKLVLKADVRGSVEALQGALEKLSTDEVRVKVVYGGVGAVAESDIMLASTSEGMVIGFGVRPDSKARKLGEKEGVEIRTYSIIYDVVDDVKKAMEGLLAPESKETILGKAQVRETFKISKVGTIAGCRIVEGKAQRSALVRVLRDSVQVYQGKIASLKSFKDDAREIESGSECGVGIEGFNDVKAGDEIEFFRVEEVARTLDSAPKRNEGAAAHP